MYIGSEGVKEWVSFVFLEFQELRESFRLTSFSLPYPLVGGWLE